jgi:predicted DNA-binding transcriptional regulator AlpA
MDQPAARPSSYLSCASLARELDISETHVNDLTKRGILPKPCRLGSSVRWCWDEVQAALASLKSGLETETSDPFLEGARNATKPKKARGHDA